MLVSAFCTSILHVQHIPITSSRAELCGFYLCTGATDKVQKSLRAGDKRPGADEISREHLILIPTRLWLRLRNEGSAALGTLAANQSQ